jgi:hypothetical protein
MRHARKATRVFLELPSRGRELTRHSLLNAWMPSRA